jgi:hypothetical protein
MGSEREFKIKIVGDASGVAPASQLAASELGKIGQAGTEAHGRVAAAAEKTVLNHHQLAQAVKGVRSEFPELYHVAHMALHPITLSVAAIAEAFQLWEARVNALQNLLSNLELPDISEMEVGHVNAMAAAFEKVGDALRQANEHATGPAAQMIKDLARIHEELGLTKGVVGAQKEALIAGGANKLDVEKAAERRINRAEEEAGSDEYMTKVRTRLELFESASEKQAKASRIKVATADDDKKTLDNLVKRAATADKEITDRKKQNDEIAEEREHGAFGGLFSGSRLKAIWRGVTTGKTDEEIEQENNTGIGNANVNKERLRRWQLGGHERDRLRAELSGLTGGVAADRIKAGEIGDELPGLLQTNRDRRSSNRVTERDHDLARSLDALAEASKSAHSISEQIDTARQAGKGYTDTLMKKLIQWTTDQKDLEKRIQALEGPNKYGARPLQ